MWKEIQTLFESHPDRLRVARFLLQNGFSVRNNKVYVNDVEIPTLKLARAIRVDRRTVGETVRMINGNPVVSTTFSLIESAGPSIRRAAKQMGLGTVEITADDPNKVGILSETAKVLAELGISIRQALVDDPELSPEPRLTLIGSKRIPGKAIPLILAIRGVSKVSVS